MSLKKFSQMRDDKSKKNENSNPSKGKAPRKYIGSSSEYEDTTNQEILAQEFTKRTADEETNIKSTKREVTIKDNKIKPNEDSVYDTKEEKKKKPSKGIVNLDEKKEVEFYGKIAKFPKDTQASKAYNFLENIKCNKSSIWYILVEKQDNELQMVKYNQKMGVNLTQFVNELKSYYISKYTSRKDLIKIFEKIEVVGEDKFSVIKNIPNLVVDGKKVITKITEDLTKLLSK